LRKISKLILIYWYWWGRKQIWCEKNVYEEKMCWVGYATNNFHRINHSFTTH